MADEAKNKGNEFFKVKNYEEAIKHYTEGIGLDSKHHVCYSNRSACYAALGKWDEALTDAESCIAANPAFAKGYSRKGAALFGARKLQEAAQAYQEGIEKFPEDASLKQGLDAVKKEGMSQGQNQISEIFKNPQVMAKLHTDPKTAGYMKDPQFMQTFQMALQNPQIFTMMMQQDQRFMACLQVALGIQMGEGGAPEAPASDTTSAPAEKKPKAEPAPKKEKEPEPEKELTEEEIAAKKKKEEALAEKEHGTAAYKKKDFETAIAHYTKAIEIDDTDISFLTNRGACHFEKGDYDECIKDCEKAIEVGREAMADFKVLARAFARIGNAYTKKAGEVDAEAQQELYSQAIEAYNRSLTEHRTDDVWTKLKKVQSAKKKASELAYQDPAKAAEEKEAGNALFKEGKWVEAMRKYSEAIKRNPSDPETSHIYYSNRGNCYIRMNEMNLAIEDFDKCIELNPKYPKAYLNKAHIKFAQKEYQKVMPIYEQVLAMEDVDEDSKKKAQEGLQRTVQAIQQMQSTGADEEQLRRAQADPEIQQILGDPMVQQVLRDFKDNPQYAQQAMKNPGMAAKLNKLAAAGVIRFG
jgi:stress-induced-phosphoprotein 1